MQHWKKNKKRAISLGMAVAMLAGVWLQPLGTVPVKAANSTEKHYDGELNKMSAEEYAEFGLKNKSPEEFDPKNTDHPLDDYEPTEISELYLGYMNRTEKWKGDFKVLDNTTEVSETALNVDNMAKTTVGKTYDLYDMYHVNNKDTIEIQTSNSCAIDYDGDGSDEILNTTLYVQKNLKNDPKKRSRIDIRLMDYNEKSDAWEEKSLLGYDLVDKDSSKKEFVWDIEADSSKCYTALTAGDFDGDGKEEAAVYVPERKGKTPDPYILIVKAKENGAIQAMASIPVSSLNSTSGIINKFNYAYRGSDVPVVSLSTTKISGRDDLVVNISHPQTSVGDNGQNSVLAIYRYKESVSNGKTSVSMKSQYNKILKYSDFRMRFASAVDADLDGNGTNELLVGGYRNYGWNSDKDVGKLDSKSNLVQIICWNGNGYEEVWNEPKKVNALSGLHLNLHMTEPAALTAGALHENSTRENVFLEGVLLVYSGENVNTSNQKNRLKNGSFSWVANMELGGSHSAFISTAYAAKYTTATSTAEQIVVLSGDHNSSDNDSIYYDIGWMWATSNGNITSKITNNDFIKNREEDDDGTFVSMCPLNVDQDELNIKYKGKSYGWSDPVLYTVLLSPPYWSELQYNSESFGVGSSTYEISYGNGIGEEEESGIGLGAIMGGSVLLGGGLGGNNVKAGFSGEISDMTKSLSGHADEYKVEESYKFAVRAGEDKAILMAVPVITYNYDMWVPSFTVDEDYINQYKGLSEDHSCPYQIGEVVEGHWEDYFVTTKQAPSFSSISLERYNELVRKYKGNGHEGLVEITEEMLPYKVIGDPSTYPHTAEELPNPENISNLFVSNSPATIKTGDDEIEIAYSVEKGHSDTSGFELSLDGKVSIVGEIEISLAVALELEGEAGLQVAYDKSTAHVTTSFEKNAFSATVKDLPVGTSEKYLYSTQMFVYNAKNMPRGDSDNAGAYVVGYIVNQNQSDTPPKIPEDFRVFGTTDNKVVLQWSSSGNRLAQSYEIFVKDNNEMPVSVCKTNNNYFIADNLKPSTNYQYAIKAYSGENQTGNASSMSRWLTARTKGDNSSEPHFTESPKSMVVVPGSGNSYTLTAKAEKGQGMEQASLTYQWQKYSQDELTKEGTWESIDGAVGESYTIPAITEESAKEMPAQSHYRVIATQTLGSSPASVISRVATVFINKTGGTQTFYETESSMQVLEDEKVRMTDTSNAYVEIGTQSIRCTSAVHAKTDSTNSPSSSNCIFLLRKDGTDQVLDGVTYTDDKTAVLDTSGLKEGDYELYCVYPGGYYSASNHNRYYLASQSAPINLHVVDVYRITYHLDDGANAPENPAFLTCESNAVEIMPASREGYEFAGWYQDGQFESPLPENKLDPQTLIGNLDLYAKWIPIEYPVSYDLNGGENNEENPDTYTVEDGTVELQEPVNPGFQFEGWYQDKGLTQPVSSISESLASSDLTYYAKWKEKLPQELQGKFESLKKSVGEEGIQQMIEGAESIVTYISSNPDVAKVSKNGKITFKDAGTATITAYAAEDDHYKSASHTCTVTVNPTKAKIKSLVSEKAGQVQIKSTKATEGNTGYEIQYTKNGDDKVYTKKVKNTKALDQKLKGIKPGTKIRLRIRAYKNVNGDKYYGKYSNYKNVTVK